MFISPPERDSHNTPALESEVGFSPGSNVSLECGCGWMSWQNSSTKPIQGQGSLWGACVNKAFSPVGAPCRVVGVSSGVYVQIRQSVFPEVDSGLIFFFFVKQRALLQLRYRYLSVDRDLTYIPRNLMNRTGGLSELHDSSYNPPHNLNEIKNFPRYSAPGRS